MTTIELLFLRQAVPAAQASMQATGVPASVTIAQAILESGWGQTGLATKANNLFGIKAVGDEAYMEFPTAEYENGYRVMIEADFASYPSWAASFTAHAQLLSTLPRYAPAMAVKSDPAEFCTQLEDCGYSTSPTYAELLLQLINEFDLTQYDAAPAASFCASGAAPAAG
jgi:flagellum-specific peptidoglycan hydrolase FlgJ